MVLPETRLGNGPLTKKYYRRFFFGYLLVALIGWSLAANIPGSGWAGFGMGAFFPGSGFIYTGGWSWIGVILSPVLLVVSLIGYYMTGGLIFPSLVWLLSAILAGLIAASQTPGEANQFALWLAPALSVVGYICYKRTAAKMRDTELASAKKRNERLAQAEFKRPEAPVFDEKFWTELSKEELDILKVTFDLALQLFDEFEGFEWYDQFLSASMRYQLNYPASNAVQAYA